jgi:hypothetical protein
MTDTLLGFNPKTKIFRWRTLVNISRKLIDVNENSYFICKIYLSMFYGRIVLKNITIFSNHKGLNLLSYGAIVLLLLSIGQLNTSFATSKTDVSNIPLYYISTRESQSPNYKPVQGPGYNNDVYLNISNLMAQPCNKAIVVFVHGWEESENIVKERLNRVKLI